MNNNISFKANYINPVTIACKEKKIYKPFEASFVAYDKNNPNDLKTLKSLSKKWGWDSYTKEIYSLAKTLSDTKKIYMLTLPQQSYDKVDAHNVLGCVLVDEKEDMLEIDFLQVNPKYKASKRPIYENKFLKNMENILFLKKDTKYKYIGTGILNSIKDFYSSIDLVKLISVFDAIEFYQKNGFKIKKYYINTLEWWRPIKK